MIKNKINYIKILLPLNSAGLFRQIRKEFFYVFTFLLVSFSFLEKTTGQVTVMFTADILEGCSPISITFTNESTPIDGSTFMWDFGNGNFSTARNPQTSYLTPGSYSVKLTVTNGGISETLTKENYITVHSNPEVRFELIGDTIGCSPFEVSFQDFSTDMEGSDLSYVWSFGDGAKSNDKNPIHSYITKGIFDVTVIVTNIHGCYSTYTESQLVDVLKPLSRFGVDQIYSCTGTLLATFSNVSEGQTALESLWDFGDGTYSNQTSPVHQYQNQGEYSVKLTVTDNYGCSDEVIRSNLINVVKTTAKFDMSLDTLCPAQNLSLTNRSEYASSYLWHLGDESTSTSTNVNKTYPNSGDYIVWLTATNGNCKDSISKKLNIEYVKANFLPLDSFICELPKTISYQNQSQNAVSWNWLFGNGSVSNSVNPSVIYGTNTHLSNNQASFSDTLIVTSKHGCNDRFIKQNSVKVHLPSVKMSPGSGGDPTALNICIPNSISFSDKTLYSTEYDFITQRQWTFNSQPVGSGENAQIDVNQTGKIPIELTITTSLGCVQKRTEYINAGQVLSPDFARVGNYEVCASEPVNFIITSPESSLITNGEWDFGDESTDLMQFPPHLYEKTGPMDVSFTVYNYGCKSSVTKPNIVKILGPIVSYNPLIDCNKPFDRVFSASLQDATHYTWSFGDETPDISNQNNIAHTFAGIGDYLVKISAENTTSGCSIEFDRTIFIRNLKSEFQISDGTPCINNTLTIDGSASNAAIDYFIQNDYGKYLWEIREENTSYFTNDMLVHKFTKKGANNVSLIVQDINGCKDTLTKEIFIYSPQPNFEANYKLGCMPITFEFTDLTQSDASVSKWLWNFGDGKTSGDQNPTHDYTEFGGFNISLEVTDEIGCIAKLTKNQLVKAIFPEAPFKASDPNLCVGDSTLFTDTSASTIIEYLWQVSDGRSSNLAQPRFTFNEPGSFTVSLNIKDSHGCETTNTQENYVLVQKYPKADFEADITNSNCYPLVVQFFDKSENEYPGSWEWHFGENDNISELEDPFFIYNRPGNHNVRLINRTTFGCSDTIVKPAYIHVGGPFATIGLRDTVCRNLDVLFLAENQQNVYDIRWDYGDGYFGLGNNAVHQYLNPGIIFPVLFIRSDADNTCNKAIIDTLTVLDLQALFDITDNIDKGCVPFGPELINQSLNSTSWIWDFGNGTIINDKVPQYQYPNAGNYNMRLIAMHSLGCKDTSEWKQITVFPLPEISVSNDTVICKGGSANLRVSGGTSYSWIPPETLSSPNSPLTQATPDQSILYQILVTDDNNCVNTENVLVSVQQIPSLQLKDTTLVIGEFLDINIADEGISSYVWTPYDYISCTNCPNPVIQPMGSISYQVAVTDTSNCFTVSYPLNIAILKQYSVDVPNAFTPNEDGVNDRVFVKGWGIKELLSFKIYNRMGQQVYSSSNLTEGWDGSYKGKPQPIETYSYQIQVITYEDEILTKSGTLKLLR